MSTVANLMASNFGKLGLLLYKIEERMDLYSGK